MLSNQFVSRAGLGSLIFEPEGGQMALEKYGLNLTTPKDIAGQERKSSLARWLYLCVSI